MSTFSYTSIGKFFSGVGVRLTVSVVLLLLAFRAVEFRAILQLLSSSNYYLLATGILLQLATRFAAAERTLVVTRALGLGISRAKTIRTLFITNFYSLFMPDAIAGGVGTIYQYGRYGITWEQSTGTLLVSRLIEFAVLVGATFVALIVDPRSPLGSTVRIGVGVACIGAGAIVLIALGMRSSKRNTRKQLPHRIGRRLVARLSTVGMIFSGVRGHDALRGSVPALFQAGLGAAGFVSFGAAMDIEMSFLTAVWVMGVAYVVTLLPLSIAGIGVREFTMVEVLALIGIDAGGALAFALLLLLSQILCGVMGAILHAAPESWSSGRPQ